jgi:hypothetical protein
MLLETTNDPKLEQMTVSQYDNREDEQNINNYPLPWKAWGRLLDIVFCGGSRVGRFLE